MRKRSENKINKKIILAILVIITSILAALLVFKYTKYEKKEVFDVTPYFNKVVKTNKESKLYIKENEEYKEIGLVGENINLELNDITSAQDKYFNINKFDNKYYINYEDVSKITEETMEKNSDRYKRYIPFNENVKTNKKTSFYDDEGNLVYSFNTEYNLPIIVKDTNKYGVEFDDKLLYIKKDDNTSVVENHNTDKINSSGVGVLNYHFFYDEKDSEARKKCNEEICVSLSQLNSELDFLEQNNIITIKPDELEMYIDGKIRLPKSVLITVDDGATNRVGLELFTKRKKYATVFLITAWFNPDDYYKSDYVELHSHGNNLHEQGRCKMGRQGGAIQCEPREKLLEDLTTSRKKLHGSTVFAYPFYEYNDYSISVLKEAGFTMAFEGEKFTRDNLVKPGMDKFRLPRFVMVDYTTKNDLKRYFGRIKA